MLGGLLKVVAHLGAWSATTSATAGAAKWISSRFRQAVSNYSKYAATSTRKRTLFTRRALESMTGHADPARQADTVIATVNYAKQRVRNSYASLLRRYNAAGRRNIEFLRKAVRDEAYAMPMNYTMYRIDKHRAVTPEEREAVSSFGRYYLGTPMALSVASGFAMERIQNTGILRKATSRIARKMAPSRKARMGKFTLSTLHAAKGIADKLSALQRAKFRSTEGRSILSLLGTIGPMKLARTIYRNYRNETTQVAGGGINNLVHKILKDHEILNETYLKRSKQMRISGVNEPDVKAFESSALKEVQRITERRLAEYSHKATKNNRFITFFNKLATDLKDPSLSMRQEFMTITPQMSTLFAGKQVPTGRYIMGSGEGTVIDFGRLSLTNMKNAAIRGMTRGITGKFLHLFGMRDILKSKDTEHSLIGAVTVTKREPLNLPMAYFDETGMSSSTDIMAQMMGFYNYKDASQKGFGKDVSDFLNSRLSVMAKEYDLDPSNRAQLVDLFKKSARHGELWLESGDLLVQMPGGEAEIITHGKRSVDGIEGKIHMPTRVKIGGHNGKVLTFMKFTREADSIPAKLVRSHTGYEEATYQSRKGRISVTHGPGKYGKIMDAIRSEDHQGLISKLKQTLDLGYSQEQSVFSKLASIFRKHADPRYPTTFFSKDYIGSPEFRNEVLKTGRSREDMVDFFRKQADSATLEYWYGATRRTGGTDELIQTLKNSWEVHGKAGIESLTDILISPGMSVGQAKERVDTLLTQLEAHRKESGDIVRHFLWRDIDNLKNIRRMFTVPGDKTVLDVIGHVSSGQKTIFGARPVSPTALDQYNALVLRIQSGLYQSGDIDPGISEMIRITRNVGAAPKILTDKERSAWYASSHLARAYHNIASQVSEAAIATEETALNGVKGSIDSILSQIATVDSIAYKDITTYYKKRWRFAPWSIWDYDHRLKWGDSQNAKTGIYLLPESSHFGLVSKRPIDITPTQTIQIAEGVMDAANISVMSLFHAFNRAASEMLGIGFDETNLSTPFQYFEKMLGQRVLPFTAMYLGYSVLDRTADTFLDGTPFGEGLTTFGANVLAGARVGAQGFLDTIGVTGMSKYLEDLMPGIITSPLSGAVRGLGPTALGMSLGMKSLGPRGALTGGIIGSAVGMLTGGGVLGTFSMWNVSKERKQVVQELLGEKEVAVQKSRWWELSGSPFEGTRIQYYRPHIYALQRSKYEQAPGFKDSLFTEMIGHIAPDWYAMKNYYSRPYPVTSGLFSNLPVFSSMLDTLTSTTSLGQLATLRGIPMHEGEFSPTYMQRQGQNMGITPLEISRNYLEQEGYFATTHGSTGESPMGSMRNDNNENIPAEPGTVYNYTESPMMRSSFEWGLGESVENVKDLVGLRGFFMGTAFESLTGRRGLFDYAPELASPADIPGIQREYYDKELGGILGASEIIRRYVPHRRNQIEMYNPIRSTAPDWLPGYDYHTDYHTGDPFTKIPLGEARLPGSSYETLHDVHMTMPLVADILGETEESQAAFFLGLPEYMAVRNREMDIAKMVAIQYKEDAKQYGELIAENKVAYNAKYNMTAAVDAIIKSSRGERTPVKVVPKGFGGESNLNAFLVLADIESGILLEVNAKTGGISEKKVKKDIQRFARELQRSGKARIAAYSQIVSLEKEGKAMNLANAYSWFDRFRILADVAHYSDEYSTAKNIVKQQINAGILPPERIAEFELRLNQVESKKKAYQFSEYRFKDRGEGLTPYTKERDRLVKENYGMLERTIGDVWERFTHLRNPLQVKLYHHMDALEEYERNAIYGKNLKQWNFPIEDYLKSYAYTAMGEDDPAQGALSWATGGFLLGGSPLAGIMAGTGAAVSGFNAATGYTFIPERTLDVREITSQADAIKYLKYKKLYQETGDEAFLNKAHKTLTGTAHAGGTFQTQHMRAAMGKPESDYFEDIINNVTRSNIDRVSKLVPDPMRASVYQSIGNTTEAQNTMNAYAERQLRRDVPELNSAIYSRNVPLEAPIITTFEQEGLNAHDAGYGWYSQMAQIERLKANKVFSGESLYDTFTSRATVRNMDTSLTTTHSLRKLLSSFGSVQISNDGADRIEVTLVARGR